MAFLRRLLNRLGLTDPVVDRHPIRVFLLEDDQRRHDWFARRFKGDQLDVAEDVNAAKEYLSSRVYDAIFLDHDLIPEHYESSETDDERTGYAIALWLSLRNELQPAATIIVHSFNADGAMRMVAELRRGGRQAEYVPFHFLEERIRNYWQR